MMAGTHVVIAVAGWTLVSRHSGLPPFEPLAAVLAITGGLLPDIDHPRSWVGRRLALIAWPMARLCGHRGVTHSLLALLAIAGLWWLVAHPQAPQRATVSLLLPMLVGYLSHLLADFLTPAGVPLLWPSRRRFAVPLVATGGAVEWLSGLAVTLWLGTQLWPAFTGGQVRWPG